VPSLLDPGHDVKVIHLLRKPLSEGTVAANVLAHGTGALNIDASRIAGINPSVARRVAAAQSGQMGGAKGQKARDTEARGSLRDRSSLEAFTTPRRGEALGRWPSNLILEHHPGCRCVGTKRVKASAAASGPTLTGRSESNSRGVFGGVESTPHYSDADGKETVAAWECALGCPVASLDAPEIRGVSRFYKQVGGSHETD
jgi:hypothetical protein